MDKIDELTIKNFLGELLSAYDFGESADEVMSVVFEFKNDLELVLINLALDDKEN